jgi:hypothetical protein
MAAQVMPPMPEPMTIVSQPPGRSRLAGRRRLHGLLGVVMVGRVAGRG